MTELFNYINNFNQSNFNWISLSCDKSGNSRSKLFFWKKLSKQSGIYV